MFRGPWRHEKWNILNVVVIFCFQFLCGFISSNFYVIVYPIRICIGTYSVISTLFASWRRDISQTCNTKSLRGRHTLVTWYSGSRSDPELRVPELLATLVCRSHSEPRVNPEHRGAWVPRVSGVTNSRVTPGCRSHSEHLSAEVTRKSGVPESAGTLLCRSHSKRWVTWVILNSGVPYSLATPGCRRTGNSGLSDSPGSPWCPIYP